MDQIVDEMLKRGMNFARACMVSEAVHSSAIEGAKLPTTKKDFDDLYRALKKLQ